MNYLLEYIIVFMFVLILNLVVNNTRKKLESNTTSTELLYLKKFYKVNIKKIDRKSFERLCLFVNAFVISTIYMIVVYLLNNLILRIVIGLILLILLLIICYGLIGKYYLKKEGK